MDDAMSLRDVLGVNFEEDDEEVFDPFASDGLSLPGAGGPGLLGAFDRKGRLRENKLTIDRNKGFNVNRETTES